MAFHFNNTFDMLGAILGSHYEIIERVIRHLTSQQLRTAALVCKTWCLVSRTLTRRRSVPETIVWPSEGGTFKRCVDGTMRYCHHIPDVKQLLKNTISYPPNICITFMSGEMLYRGVVEELFEDMRAALPECCDVIIFVTRDVLGSLTNHMIAMEHSSEAFSALLIPQMLGVEVISFKLPIIGRHHTKIVPMKPDEFLSKTGFPLERVEKVKCLLLFSESPNENSELMRLLHTFNLCRQNRKFALGGLYPEQAIMSHPQEVDVSCVGVAFLGDGLQAASLVIPGNVIEEKRVEDYILKLKACDFSMRKSMAFQFSSSKRGWWQVEAEAEIFRTHFPYTPLVGASGRMGEVGVTFVPGKNVMSHCDLDLYKGGDRSDYIHMASTVFVLLAW